MARKRLPEGRYCVSGPGVDREGIESPGAAISFAQARAERVEAKEATYYVRDLTGKPVARVERRSSGVVETFALERTR